jgi:hypothetical protein
MSEGGNTDDEGDDSLPLWREYPGASDEYVSPTLRISQLPLAEAPDLSPTQPDGQPREEEAEDDGGVCYLGGSKSGAELERASKVVVPNWQQRPRTPTPHPVHRLTHEEAEERLIGFGWGYAKEQIARNHALRKVEEDRAAAQAKQAADVAQAERRKEQEQRWRESARARRAAEAAERAAERRAAAAVKREQKLLDQRVQRAEKRERDEEDEEERLKANLDLMVSCNMLSLEQRNEQLAAARARSARKRRRKR